MKLLGTWLIGLMMSSLGFAYEQLEVEKAKILLNPQKLPVNVALVFGTVLDGHKIAKIPAKIILEGRDKVYAIQASVSMPISFGPSFGKSVSVNGEISLYKFNKKMLSDLFGLYGGTRLGGAVSIVGGSYFVGNNQSGIKIHDFDYRAGLKVDILSGDFIMVEPVETEVPEILLLKI